MGSSFILGVICVLLTDFSACNSVSVYERQSVCLFMRELPFDSVSGLLSASLHYYFALR